VKIELNKCITNIEKRKNHLLRTYFMDRNGIDYAQDLLKLRLTAKIIESHNCIHPVISRIWRANALDADGLVLIPAGNIANVVELPASLFKYRTNTVDATSQISLISSNHQSHGVVALSAKHVYGNADCQQG